MLLKYAHIAFCAFLENSPRPIKLRAVNHLYRRRCRIWKSLAKDQSKVFWLEPGVRMYLYRDSELCRLIYLQNFESDERWLTKLLLRPGDTYVDVGANIGLFSLLAANHVTSRGKVISFEPVNQTYARLSSNIKINGYRHITAENMALSDTTGTSQISLTGDGYDAWNSLGKPYMGSVVSTQDVRTIRWDDYADRHQLHGQVNLMKIDVEGWENHVLNGAAESFKRSDAPDLYVEFTEQAAHMAGSSCAALHENLLRLGYQLFLPNSKAKAWLPFPKSENYPQVNVIATKNLDRLRALSAMPVVDDRASS